MQFWWQIRKVSIHVGILTKYHKTIYTVLVYFGFKEHFMAELDFDIEIGYNQLGAGPKPTYCANAGQLYQKARELGLSAKEIAAIAGGAGDTSTIYGWKSKKVGDLEMCQRVYDHLKTL
jgi:hypothetical protein